MIKQSAAQNIGRAGERWFQSILPKEWIFQKPEEDIGLDGKIIIGSENTTGGFEFGVQIKSSNEWQIKDGDISVDGIKMDTLLYWGSRTFPTLLVLYDVSKNIGYYGWAFDLVSQPIEFAVPFVKNFNKKTLTLKMSEKSILDKDGFQRIKIDVDNFYLNLINSVTALRKSMNILPIINRLTEALRGLYISFVQQPKDKDQIMLIGLMMVTSHKQVIRTMNELQMKYHVEIGSTNFIQYFITVYKSEVSKIIHDFDSILDKDEPHIVMANPEAHYKITPKLIDMIMDLILILTDDKHKECGTVFTFE
jgi:hypothetical protein